MLPSDGDDCEDDLKIELGQTELAYLQVTFVHEPAGISVISTTHYSEMREVQPTSSIDISLITELRRNHPGIQSRCHP